MKIRRIPRSAMQVKTKPRLYIKRVKEIKGHKDYVLYDNSFLMVLSDVNQKSKESSENILNKVKEACIENNFKEIRIDSKYFVTMVYDFYQFKNSLKKIFSGMDIELKVVPHETPNPKFKLKDKKISPYNYVKKRNRKMTKKEKRIVGRSQ